MTAETLMERNVVAIPSATEYQQAIDTSAMLGCFNPHYLLGPQALPHVSLYQTGYPTQNEHRLLTALDQVTATLLPFEIVLSTWDIFWATFLFWDAPITKAMRSVHQQLVNVLLPIREGKILAIHQKMLADPAVSEELKQSIRRAGSPVALEKFRPHMTVVRCQTEEAAHQALVFAREQNFPPLRFTVDALYVTDVGEHGESVNILECFPLGGT